MDRHKIADAYLAMKKIAGQHVVPCSADVAKEAGRDAAHQYRILTSTAERTHG
jgi:hypothetical protein